MVFSTRIKPVPSHAWRTMREIAADSRSHCGGLLVQGAATLTGEHVVLCPAVGFAIAPLRLNPPLLLQLVQRGYSDPWTCRTSFEICLMRWRWPSHASARGR